MDTTWASGAIELLQHAVDHIGNDSAFDKRMAFISIDNCVETSIRTFLSLPKQFFSGAKPSRNEIEQASNNFTELLNLLSKYAKDKLREIDFGDIEHYHRIRNTLYHEGTGLSVDEQYLNAYFTIAIVILKRLFRVDYDKVRKTTIKEISVSNLIVIWDQIEKLVDEIFEMSGIDKTYTYKWEEAVKNGIMTYDEIQNLTHLRLVRNSVVHSGSIDINLLKGAISQSNKLKEKFTEIKNRISKKITR